MSRNWEVARRQVSEWYALVERCRATLAKAQSYEPLNSEQAAELLLREHPELQDLRQARNAVDYVDGRKGRKARR
jgi:hypothetical protein